MDIAEPVEKAAALHVDAGEKTKIVVETEVHTNSDSLKRRHSTELKPENNAKKLKTSNNGESVEEDDDNDLIAKLDAIPAPVLNKEITKPADLLKKLEEDGKRDDLLERMERIVEGKSLANSTRQTETDEAFMAKLEEATKPKEEPKKVTEEKKASESPQKAAEVNDKPKEESKKVEEIKKDVPKPEEVRKEEPKPEVKVDKVEKMEVDGEKPSPTKKPTKEKNDENVISSTTGSASSAPKAVEAKNLPADTANIPSQKSPEVTSMGDVKQDVKVDAKDKTSVAEKSEPVKEMKDAEATPMKSSSDEKVLDSGKVQKQRNGVLTSIDIASTTLDEKDVKAESTDAAERGDKTAADAVAISNGKDAGESLVKESVYEVNFCFEENEIKYLYIDKVDKDGQKSDDAPSTSSNGDKTVSQSGESGSKEATEKFAVPALPKSTVTIKGISSLCSFIVERMREFSPEEEAEEMGKKKGKSLGTKSATSTPKSQKSTPVAAKASTSSRRVSGKTATPVAKESPATKAVSGVQEGKVGYAVMARWVDKMYYAGRVSAEKSGGKFAIHFADGALKTLNRDQIVFGHGDLLPFLDQSVHALVEGDTYEPGLVTEVTMDQDEQVLYTVVTESKTVVRTASDIYLEEDQAKNLQAAIKKDPQTGLMDLSTAKRVRRESSASESEASGRKVGRKSDPKEAEAGFSGGDAKKGRRGKR
ncbi:nucleolar protein dao-5-like isoform X2 [Phlebotomus argentipes]|nr:nucleolar protein dao-5-like isoform X2 [Phlebotomus argentipes]